MTVDQAHRGYTLSDDSGGFRSVNPLFMKYIPSDGRFAGQQGYGYRSLEAFVEAAIDVNQGRKKVHELSNSLALAAHTLRTTAILEAGRLSLDNQSKVVTILYEDPTAVCSPTSLKLQ